MSDYFVAFMILPQLFITLVGFAKETNGVEGTGKQEAKMNAATTFRMVHSQCPAAVAVKAADVCAGDRRRFLAYTTRKRNTGHCKY